MPQILLWRHLYVYFWLIPVLISLQKGPKPIWYKRCSWLIEVLLKCSRPMEWCLRSTCTLYCTQCHICYNSI